MTPLMLEQMITSRKALKNKIFNFNIYKTIYFSSHSDVVSTVGPRGQHPEVLQSAYRACLEKMLELELKTIVS